MTRLKFKWNGSRIEATLKFSTSKKNSDSAINSCQVGFFSASIRKFLGSAVVASFTVGAATLGISGLPLAATTNNIPVYLCGLFTAYIVGFIATWLIGFDDPPEV